MNFTEKEWLELLELSNKLPPVVEIPLTPAPLNSLTKSQKRRNTAILTIQSDLKDLNHHLQGLIRSKRQFMSKDPNQSSPTQINKSIKHLRKRIWRKKYTLKCYENGHSVKHLSLYKQGKIEFTGLNPHFKWFRGLMLDLYFKVQRYVNKEENRLPDRPLQLSKKAYPPSHHLRWRRLQHIVSNLDPYGVLFLEVQDGRWITNYMLTVAKRLERERAINEYLPKADDQSKENPDYRRQTLHGIHRHKYAYIELEDIYQIRGMDTLAYNPWIQLRNDERDYLIKVTLELHEQLKSVFLVLNPDTKL